MTEELKIRITAQVDKLKQGVQEAKKAVNNFTDGAEKGASKMDEAFKAAGDGIKNALSSAAKIGATAIAGLGTALIGSAAATEEYRVAQAKLNTAFEAAGSTVETASQTYNDLYRVLGDSDVAVEAANHLAKLTTNQKDLSDWTNICQGIYATFGDSLPIEGLTEAANETAKVGAVTGPLADALNWAGVSEDKFNEKLSKCRSEQEREALIRKTLNGLYSEAAAGYEENASGILKQNEAQAKLQKNLAAIGETMQPFLADLTMLAGDILAKIVPYIQQIAEQYGPMLKDVLSTAGGYVKEIVGFIVENWVIIASIAGVIGGIAVAIGLYNTVAAVKAAMAAAEVTTVWALVAAYIAQGAAMLVAIAPYVLIVAAIAAVIAIIVLCVKHWDTIKEKTAEVIEKIKNGISAGVEKIKEFVSGLWTNLKDGAKGAWEGIKSVFSKVTNWFKDVFSKAWSAVKAVFSTGGKIFSGIKDGIANVFKTVVNGIISGINTIIAVPFKAINGMLNKIRGISVAGVEPFKSLWKQDPLTVPQIPKLAKGGIVDGATLAMIGEQGKEAIVPLENNTEWLDKLAAKINGTANNKPARIVLNVDGKTFAQTSINTINDLTRQTGSLKLNIM